MTPPDGTFAEFYAAYLEAHRHPWNRALHLSAKLAMLGLVLLAALRGQPAWLLAVPIAGVLPCWIGHLLFEGNRPTSWTRPSASLLGAVRRLVGRGSDSRVRAGERRYWSFLADLRMCAAMLGLGRRQATPVPASGRRAR
jgi:hypothetical protein